MDTKTVFMTPCQNYDVDLIEEILRNQMDKSGVLALIKEGMTIALKLNLVSAMKPDTAGTTHPAIVEALCRILIGVGAKVVMGDSPGGPFNWVYLKNVYNICGITAVAEKTGAILNSDFEIMDVDFPDAAIAKNITVTSWLYKADAIINCCKLKTHGMMGMSAAVKNMFGSIPGTQKPEYHFRFPKQEDFANMLIDIQEYWKPKMIMHLVDAVVGMEGNGPTAGKPRKIGLLMTGQNPYSLDLVGGRIIGFEQNKIMTMLLAYERHLAAKSADDVNILIGSKEQMATVENIKEYMISDYELIENNSDLQFGGKNIFEKIRGGIITLLFTTKPKVKKDECIGCEKCKNVCPAKAISMKDKIPEIDRSKCIKCFCCQEFCPKGAMKVHRTFIARLLSHK